MAAIHPNAIGNLNHETGHELDLIRIKSTIKRNSSVLSESLADWLKWSKLSCWASNYRSETQ